MSVPGGRRLAGLLLLLAAVSVPFLLDDYGVYILNLALVYAMVGIGLNLLLGYTGQFAFAQAALMGIGAYTAAILMTRLAWPFWVTLPAAGIVTSLIGSICTLPSLRMRSVYLALVTLAFAELVVWVLLHWKSMTLGTDGIPVRPPHLFGVRVDRGWPFSMLAGVVLAILYGCARVTLDSSVGRAFVAVRENEILAQCSGINVARTKLVAFMLCAFYAGIGGAFFAVVTGYIAPASFDLDHLVVLFSAGVVGGLLSLPGAIIGALLMTVLPELLRDVQSIQEIVFGLLLTVCIVSMPEGIAGFLRRRGVLPPEILARGWRRLR
jgi:branched-chain amino acid transport system permease protein